MSRPTLYEQVLGANYTRLPIAVQRFHRLTGRTVLHGWVETHAPGSAPARFLAYCLGTPRSASSGTLRFEIEAGPESESWTRHFPSRTMTSHMRLVGGQVEERLGAAQLTFSLAAVDGKLKMELARMRFLGVPCPKWLMPRIVAEETGTEDRLHFHVVAALPLIGVVASYRGYLDLGSMVAP
jgi:Domain of unknown function (DUF4166)